MATRIWYGAAANHEGDWGWGAAQLEVTLNNAAAVDKGGGLVGIPSTAHGFLAGDSVTLAGTSNYDGTYTLGATTSANEMVITATYQVETFAGTETATNNEGSNWLDTAGADANIPANSDDVVLENSSQSVTSGLDQSGVALATLTARQSFTGYVGTAAAYLQIGSSIVRIGEYFGTGTVPAGSSLIKLDLGATAAAVDIFNAGTPLTTAAPAIYIKANSASTVVRIRKGKVAIAPNTGETTTVGTIQVSYVSNQATDAVVQIGSGVTLTTLLCKGSDTTLLCAATTVTQEAGTLKTEGAGAIGTVKVTGGTATLNSTGTITLLEVSKTGLADFTKSSAGRTVSTAKLDPDGRIKADPSVITFSNLIQPLSTSGNVQFQASAA